MTKSYRPPGRRRQGLLVALLLVGAGLAALFFAISAHLGPFAQAPAPTGDDLAATLEISIPPRPDDAFAMTVEYVIDGDTIKARVNEPNEVIATTDRLSVRLIGIDTPESRPEAECFSGEATDHLSEMLPEGSTVWASPDTEWYDRYDRALLYLWTDSGEFVNFQLMAAGDAESLVVQPNDLHADLFASVEDAARSAGAGQWSACR
ncbi:thermonuclease family protein (plasmid) [Coraliomargarita sp. W4R53]